MSGIEQEPEDRFHEIRRDLALIGELVAACVRTDGEQASAPVLQAWLRLQFNIGYVCGENGELRRTRTRSLTSGESA